MKTTSLIAAVVAFAASVGSAELWLDDHIGAIGEEYLHSVCSDLLQRRAKYGYEQTGPGMIIDSCWEDSEEFKEAKKQIEELLMLELTLLELCRKSDALKAENLQTDLSKLELDNMMNPCREAILVTFDSYKIQNGFGAWSHHSYTCKFTHETYEVEFVQARNGFAS